MKKSKLVSLLALLGCSLGLAACGQPAPTPSTGGSSADTSSSAGESQDAGSSEDGKPDVGSSEDAGGETSSSESVEEKTPVFSFTGTSVIDEESYNCALECYDDNTFALKVGTVGKFEGTYRLVDHVGYEFTFTQTREVLLTTYDATTHKHSLTYLARLGENGSGPVTLTYEDATFVYVEKNAFIYGVTLRGTSSMILGTQTDKETGETKPKTEGVSLALKLDVDGKAHLLANRPEELTMDGTYTFTNNTFKVTLGAKTFTSTFDVTNGAYNLPVEFDLGEKYDNQKIKTSLRYETKFNGKGHGLSDATNIMGSQFGVTLTLDDHGNALFDGYTVNPLGASMGGMPLDFMFDRKGTYVMLDDGNVAVTVVNDPKRPQGGRPQAEGDAPAEPEAPKTTTFTSTCENGVYTLVYKLGGSDGNFVFNLKGTDFGLPQGLVGKSSITAQGHDIPLDIVATFNAKDKTALVRVISHHDFMDGKWTVDPETHQEVYTPGNFDQTGTYEIVDGVMKVTLGSAEPVSVVWDDAAGTYTMPFAMAGNEGSVNVNLVAQVYA